MQCFLPDGDGLKKPLGKTIRVLRADSPWSIYAWVKPAEALKMPSLVAGIGDPEEEFSRYLALTSDHLILWMGKDNSLFGPAASLPGNGISSPPHLTANSSDFTPTALTSPAASWIWEASAPSSK